MSAEWALEVFDAAPYVTVSMVKPDGTPYGLPLSLARTDDNTFWFHGAQVGEKIDVLKANPAVCLSAVTKCHPLVGPMDNSFTLEFKSAMAYGKAELVESVEEKTEGLRAICSRFLPGHMAAFDAALAKSLAHTAVVKITLTAPPTGKRKQYDSKGVEMKYQRME